MHEGLALRCVGESGRVHGIASAEIDDGEGESLAVPGVGKRADGLSLGLEAPQRELAGAGVSGLR